MATGTSLTLDIGNTQFQRPTGLDNTYGFNFFMECVAALKMINKKKNEI